MSRRTRDFESPASAIPPLRLGPRNSGTLSQCVGAATIFVVLFSANPLAYGHGRYAAERADTFTYIRRYESCANSPEISTRPMSALTQPSGPGLSL